MNNIEAYQVVNQHNYHEIRQIFDDAMKVLLLAPKANVSRIKEGVLQVLIHKVGLTPEQANALYSAEFDIEGSPEGRKTPI